MSDLEDEIDNEILALAGDDSKRSEQASELGGSQSGSGEESRRTSGQKRKNRGSRSPSHEGEYFEDGGKDKRRRGSPEYGPDLYRDRNDRERLGTLNELARERILADRAEKKQHHLDLHAVQQLFDPSDDKSKRSSRAKNASKKKFSELRRRRAEKEQKIKSGSQSPELDEHVSSSNDEYEKDGSDTQEDITLQELRTIQVSRHMLVNWMFAPFLTDAVVGCFVRLHIGDREDKQVYRLCEIEGVETTENKYYVDKTITNKVLRLRHADAVKCWPMDIVSNQYVDQSEFERWLITMKHSKLDLPSKDLTARKQEDLNKAKEYILTEKDVENIVQQKKALRGEKKELTIEKSNLTTLKYFAELRGDIGEAKELDTRIQEISEELEAKFATERDPTDDIWARINARNKKQNKEDARAAEQRKMELAKGIKKYVPHEIKKEPNVKKPKGEGFEDNDRTVRMSEFKKLIYISDIPLKLRKDSYWNYNEESEKVEAEYSIKYTQFRERIDSNRSLSFRDLMQRNQSEQLSLLSAHML